MPLPQFRAVKIPNAINAALPNSSNLRLTRPSFIPDVLTALSYMRMYESGRKQTHPTTSSIPARQVNVALQDRGIAGVHRALGFSQTAVICGV